MHNSAALDLQSARPLRVLVADPDAEARHFYVETLRALGCDLIEAGDGREALVEALVHRPSLIVLTSRLPLVNGAALCEIIRRDSATHTVPIVAIAAETAVNEIERIRRAGADSVLTKPVSAAALVAELRRLTGPDAAGPARAVAAAPEPVLPAKPEARKRIANSKLIVRCTTTTPPATPPSLRCPSCDGALVYEYSHLGGVNQYQPEQWDDYICPACGEFEYRHRTRRLRELTSH
jgi:CheY-like chemotaxis protein